MPARWPVLALWIIRLPEQRLNVRKIDGFWDSSAIVPLCVDQGASPIVKTARKSQSISVWWGTPVEVTSAFARLLRESHVSNRGLESALQRLSVLEKSWIEV